MADYSDAISKAKAAGYSDSEIADFLSSKEPGIQQARDAGYGDSDIIGHLGQAPQEGLVSDTAKSIGSGLANGTAFVAGAIPAATSAIKGAANKYLFDPLFNSISGPRAQDAPEAPDPSAIASNAIQGAAAQVDHTPQHAIADTLKRVSEGVPMAALSGGLGLGSMASNLLGGAVVPGLAGGAMKQLTGSDTAADIASMGAGLAGPMVAAKLAKYPMMALKNVGEVKQIADAQFDDPILRNSTVDHNSLQQLGAKINQDLLNKRFTDKQAGDVYDVVKDLQGANGPQSIADLHAMRSELGDYAQQTQDFKPTRQAKAAGVAKAHLDDYLDNISPQQVVSGNPQQAVANLRSASANWNKALNAQDFENRIGNAGISAANQNSGMNFGNIARRQFAPLLKNGAAKLKAMGADPGTVSAINTLNQGDFTTNMLRRLSNVTGGGGGLGHLLAGHLIGGAIGGAGGYEEAGPWGGAVGTALGMLPGHVLRTMTNRRVLNQAQAIQQAMVAQAPANSAINTINAATKASNAAAKWQAFGQGAKNAVVQALLAKYGGNGQ